MLDIAAIKARLAALDAEGCHGFGAFLKHARDDVAALLAAYEAATAAGDAAYERAAEAVDALFHVDSSAEYNQGVDDALQAIRALAEKEGE
jgi:hypothetical protein